MKTIRLYGYLGEKFGKVHRLDVSGPAEAVRALCVLYPEFRKEVVSNPQASKGFRVVVGNRDVAKSPEFRMPCANVEHIKIIPMTCGAGGEDGGLWQVVAGFVLVVINSYTGLPTGQMGVALMLGGVSTLLADTPVMTKPPEDPANQPSYMFDGAVNTTAQGNPVPLAYGNVFAGSQVISAGMSVEQVL